MRFVGGLSLACMDLYFYCNYSFFGSVVARSGCIDTVMLFSTFLSIITT
jgi:hypothetical protein